MSSGPELDRVKEYLRLWTGERAQVFHPTQRPHYPLFPGLRHEPFHDPREFPAVAILEREFASIRGEALALDDSVQLDYTQTLRLPPGGPGAWTLYLFHHMGVEVESVTNRCPKTLAVIRSLPGTCTDYVWADTAFSSMGAGTHLRPHCSTDNLRVRIHLGVDIPDGCLMRVGDQTRAWEEGKCLAFEDSFEHEVWNRSSSRRIVLIVDLWHPDLTAVERRALTAAFRKSDVRRIFLHERIGLATPSETHVQHIRSMLERHDDSPLVKEFWLA